MPITVTCSGCGRKSVAPDSAAGSKAQCKACRTIMTIPGGAKTKVCVTCGIDVSQRKRTKDAEGNYYCEPCWAARAQAAAGVPPVDDVIHYPCYVCDTLFTPDEVYDEGGGRTICKACWEARQNQPQPASGLELVDGGAASGQQSGDLFCEGCSRLFPPQKLKLSKDGAVLCKQCSKSRERVA
ncbi:MAG: hypothetical protein JWN24_3494 [Phycisphaerales bacterium]|nr:hypothetical protein [Phycisphaerales bacterium]